MTYITDQLFPRAIGFDRLFNTLNNSTSHNVNSSYPPFNIIRSGENTYIIDMAVAGFTENEISVTVEDNVLIVKGGKEEAEDPDKVIYRGISTKRFTQKFTVADTLEIQNATMDNGILSITLLNVVPESKKPKVIEITKPQLLLEENNNAE